MSDYGEHIADLAGYGVQSGELRDYSDPTNHEDACPVCDKIDCACPEELQ